MTTLEEKAEQTRDVTRADSATGAYRLESLDLTPAEDIGPEDQFPQYGDFLSVTALTRQGNENGEQWLECPAGLAAALLELDPGVGDTVVVTEASKTDDGEWTFTVESGDAASKFMGDDS